MKTKAMVTYSIERPDMVMRGSRNVSLYRREWKSLVKFTN